MLSRSHRSASSQTNSKVHLYRFPHSCQSLSALFSSHYFLSTVLLPIHSLQKKSGNPAALVCRLEGGLDQNWPGTRTTGYPRRKSRRGCHAPSRSTGTIPNPAICLSSNDKMFFACPIHFSKPHSKPLAKPAKSCAKNFRALPKSNTKATSTSSRKPTSAANK